MCARRHTAHSHCDCWIALPCEVAIPLARVRREKQSIRSLTGTARGREVREPVRQIPENDSRDCFPGDEPKETVGADIQDRPPRNDCHRPGCCDEQREPDFIEECHNCSPWETQFPCALAPRLSGALNSLASRYAPPGTLPGSSRPAVPADPCLTRS